VEATTMKQVFLVGALAGLLVSGAAYAQAPDAPKKSSAAADQGEGHTAPKQQPSTTQAATAPAGDMALGSVHLPKPVKADGKTLPAGTYQVRLTAQTANPDAKGQSPTLERWVEFVQGGQVKGREVVTIVPQNETNLVQKDTPPKGNASKIETLKGGDYMRLWIRRGGTDYLVHFPSA